MGRESAVLGMGQNCQFPFRSRPLFKREVTKSECLSAVAYLRLHRTEDRIYSQLASNCLIRMCHPS